MTVMKYFTLRDYSVKPYGLFLFVRLTNISTSKKQQIFKHKTKLSPVTKGDMKDFVGIFILMGIVRLQRFSIYLSSDEYLHQQGIVSIMPRTRFFQIWRYFQLADNSTAVPRGQQGYDKIYRIRNVLTILCCVCQNSSTKSTSQKPPKQICSEVLCVRSSPLRQQSKILLECMAFLIGCSEKPNSNRKFENSSKNLVSSKVFFLTLF